MVKGHAGGCSSSRLVLLLLLLLLWTVSGDSLGIAVGST